MLQSLIQKQLAAFFPNQAADLQAPQDVSSSVSTSEAIAVPMPEGIRLPSISGIGAAAKRAGLAIVSAPAALLAGAFVLAGTNSAGGEDINESFDLGDYGSLNVTGIGSETTRTLTITAPDGSKTIITGRLNHDENGPRHFTLKSGTIEDRAMTPGELRYFSSILSGKNVNAVYSESTEDGEEGKPTRPADKEQQDIEFAVAEGGALASTPNPDPDDDDQNNPEDKKTIKKRAIEWAGKAIKTLPAQVVSRAILLATTLPAGEGIDETFELKDGGEVSITGQDLDRTLTFKTVSGDEIIITGRQVLHPTDPGYLSLSGGTINGEAMSASELQDASGMLSDGGVNAAFEEAETRTRPTNEQALDRLRTVIDAAIQETDEAKGLQMISEALKEHEPYLIDKAVPRVHPNVEPSMNPQTYMDFHKIIGENHSGLGRPQPGKGSIEGMPEAYGSNDDETVRSLVREEDVAFVLKELGYKIEWKPDIESEDDLDFNKDPDYRINGHIYDCYASISDKVRNVWDYIRVHKIENRQTKRVILNLVDSPLSVAQVLKQFKEYPIAGMLDLIIIK
ncbi:hypothetical protein [Cohaesibacter gelatinilyticus]|uniref:tRNA nuclease CdiA C-terminal domain-containing protein n=1 Tax=Cohaesibacter gelatinilyticus TaxID=372072 RepID=A0A285PK15_9HYPH|nr:hypothetical protein [Cohaesibacter gelatinilyticus]SNZ21748.1 hypothetical protein SAMN06265368_4878 [Cohaesibacter gelatinilyticus]